jgi:hypothetical protein
VHKGESVLDCGDASPAQLEDLLITPLDIQCSRVAAVRRRLAHAEQSSDPAGAEKLRLLLAQETARLQDVTKEWEADPFAPRLGKCSLIHQTLRCRTLKWPHHVWFPRTAREEKLMKAMLCAMEPDEVLIGVAASSAADRNSRQLLNLNRIKNLVNEAVNEGRVQQIRIRTTKDGDIEYQVLMESLTSLIIG